MTTAARVKIEPGTPIRTTPIYGPQGITKHKAERQMPDGAWQEIPHEAVLAAQQATASAFGWPR